MKSKHSERKLKREKLEERIKFFMNKQTINNSGNHSKKNE